MKFNQGIKKLFVLACGVLVLSQPAWGREVNNVKLDETVHVGNADLVLNGAGVRTKFLFKVYVCALYLKDKRATTAAVLAEPGPKRIELSMLRTVDSDTFGEAFMEGLHNNTSLEERSQLVNQMFAFGHIFGSYQSLKPGDIVTVDWIPGTGTVVQLNGKQIADPLPDVHFYNALLRIWLGNEPADSWLKPHLLGKN